jgi:hypothetical protein
VRVKSHTQVGGLHIAKYIFQGIYKTKNGACVFTLGIVAWVLDKGIIGSIDESICI